MQERNVSSPTLPFSPPWQLAKLPKETPVLLALSGGADSCALLRLLVSQAKQDGFPLAVAHVQHGIRGEEAERDADFCRRLAAEEDLPFFELRADVPALAAAHGRGLEEEAREVRYAFFAQLMEEQHIPLLATAHHADDNLETVLFRLCRGSTLRGVCGILPCRPFANGFVVRPLLSATAAEIRAYCAAHPMEYVTDSTNAQPCCTRNRIRAEVVPVLEQLFSEPQKRVTQFAKSAWEDEEYLSAQAQAFLAARASAEGLSVEALQTLPNAVLRRVLKQYVRERLGTEPESKHVEALMQWVRTPPQKATRSLYGGGVATVENGRLRLLDHAAVDALPQDAIWPFQLGKQTLLPTNIAVFAKKIEKNTKVHKLSTAPYIIIGGVSDIIIDELHWRLRRQGDEMLLHGMHRKLRRLYNEKKIPPRIRRRLPLLCDAKGILWAPFIGLRDGASFDGAEDCMVELLLPPELLPVTSAPAEELWND